LIVGVFTAIAVAGSPRHHLRHGRAFPGEQKPVLLFEALQPTRRYVVLASRRGLVSLRFSRKPFSHIVVLKRESSGCHKALRKWPCLFIRCRLDSALKLAQRCERACRPGANFL